MAAMWPANRSDDGRRRLGAALALSLAAHALVLVGIRGARFESPPPVPFVVTMLAPGGGDGGAVEALRPAPVAVSAPAVAAPVVAAPVVAKRVAPPRRPAVRPAAATASVPVAPSGELARPDAASDAPAAPAAGSPGAFAAVGAGGAGGGSGGGAGAGVGGGGDGLRAFCRSCPAPEYPSRARRQGWQGTVDVELAIGGDGAVETARIGRSSGYPALDDVAVAVARTSRFAVPASGEGLRGQLRYRFVLDETAARR